ncbi:hypothetical protein D9758_000346 [Tetrapyrgos nigripes]|uniref:Delta 8-(E)-sphingolipid desaturase n=1 Tax=Tetrapyrgos nigripes TaxID=182062 RepID=A0A8H5H2K4_9AGAR|nr:hypothetical protein D9758_000346 [Tetrapyrgos nigripes]
MSLARDDVSARILQGQHILIYNRHVIRVPGAWLANHPGGDLAILHFVGRDATNEIDAFHADTALILRYSIGQLAGDEPWQPLLPPIACGWSRRDDQWLSSASTFHPDSAQVLLVAKDSPAIAPTLATITPPPSTLSLQVQHQHAQAYKHLHKRITDAGLYHTPYLSGYGPEFLRYVSLALVSFYAFRTGWIVISALALGLLWHQLMFFAHDLGHMGVTHNWTYDRLISILIANFIGGLSIGWWVDNHNIHHLVTNHPSHDPDIEHLPFFAISPKFFTNLYSSYYGRILPFDFASRLFVSVQHKLFYIVMLFARFNLYRLSYVSLYNKAFDTKRSRGGKWAWRLEMIGIIFFWTWFAGLVLRNCGSWQKALLYMVVSHVTTSPLHVQIVLSHFSMSTIDLGPTESFPARQLRTTSDVICPESVEFLHGGLHLQVAHHLFPRLPRHNLRNASIMIKEFCKEEGLTYAEFGFVKGNQEVIGVLREVAGMVKDIGQQIKLVADVASVEAREAVNKKMAQGETSDNGNGVLLHSN